MVRPYDLTKLIAASMKEIFYYSFNEKNLGVFPSTINEYTFVEELAKVGPKKSYQLAIYQNKNGQKAFAKMLNKQVKGYHYYSLQNEIQMYHVLNELNNNSSTSEKNNGAVKIPEFLGHVETNEILLLLLEFLEGEPTIDFSDEKKIQYYFAIADYLTEIGKKMSINAHKRVSTRNWTTFASLYPVLLLKSIINFPHKSILLLMGIPYMIKGLFYINKYPDVTFAHRDLHFYNIMHNKEQLILIDLQQCVFIETLHEYVTTLRYYWYEEKFRKLFLQELKKRYTFDEIFLTKLQALMINSVTHGLTDKGFSDKVIATEFEFLELAVSPNFAQKLKEIYE